MSKKKIDPLDDAPERANTRQLALHVALHGADSARGFASDAEIKKAESYLSSLATSDGRVALGGTLLILQSTIERANANGNDKTVIDGAVKYAELAKLADFSEADVSARAAQSEREKQALAYLESTGVIPAGLELPEAARLTAQYIVDDILSRKATNEQ